MFTTKVPKFSLVVATVNRSVEFGELIDSLIAQQEKSIELIVVDQNSDERLSRYVDLARTHFAVKHILAPLKGASRARNIGMAQASGQVLAFPDDDCWYPPNLLNNIEQWFHQHPSYDLFSVGAKDKADVNSGNRWIQQKCDIGRFNSLRTTFCNSLFFRRSSLPPDLSFDESFFPGEETDLVLRLLALGLKGRFDKTWNVGHPRRDMLSGTSSKSRAMLYGRAIGQLLRKHSMYGTWLVLVCYDFARSALVAISGRLNASTLCLYHGCGIATGILVQPQQLTKPAQPVA